MEYFYRTIKGVLTKFQFVCCGKKHSDINGVKISKKLAKGN
jgi:hypothetical protein